VEGVDFMQHALDRIKRWAVVDLVMNSLFARNAEIFFIDLSKISVSVFEYPATVAVAKFWRCNKNV
jgi:hypothetical protein